MNAQSRLLVILLVLPALSAHAAAIVHESIEQMARRAPTIIRGIVESQIAQWDAQHRTIRTLTTIQVKESMKGRALRRIIIQTPGGEVDGIGQRVPGAPVFRQGEEVVLFLEPAKRTSHFVVSGLAAGKVAIEPSPTGHQAVRKLEGLQQVRSPDEVADHVQALDEENLGSADSFLQRVRNAVKSERTK